MESLIARLLNDFENGRMSRRQLVQSLAMAAVAAPFASARGERAFDALTKPATAAPMATPWKTVWLDHISFGCSDYKRSTDFYTDLMGWKVVQDTGKQAVVDIAGVGQIIIRNRRPPGAGRGEAAAAAAPATPPAGAPPMGRGPQAPVTAVIDHIAFGIEPWDTETVRSELLKRGLTPREDTGTKEPMTTSKYKSFHVKDPDGWDLQISNATREHHDLP